MLQFTQLNGRVNIWTQVDLILNPHTFFTQAVSRCHPRTQGGTTGSVHGRCREGPGQGRLGQGNGIR